MNILVNFSGGIDSTLVALRALESPHKVILHHLILKNKINRWKPELKAVQNLIILFKKEFQFEYLETQIDTTQVSMIYDSLYTIQMATAICYSKKDLNPIEEIHVGFIKDDNLASFNYQQVINAPFELDPPKLIKPLINLTKKETIKELPAKYLKECFWCRLPKQDGSPCGHCHSCKLYKQSIKE
jgi:7-cyano-7-deazaguanine synthase in queuosine biosynthesis